MDRAPSLSCSEGEDLELAPIGWHTQLHATRHARFGAQGSKFLKFSPPILPPALAA